MTAPALSFSGRCRDFRRFQEAIYSHADTFTASGRFGLQGLVRSDADFLSLQANRGIAVPESFARFNHPGERLRMKAMAEKTWTFLHTRAQDQDRDVAALKTFIVSALDPSSLARLSDAGGITAKSVPDVMDYLRTTFGTVPAAEIHDMEVALALPFRVGDSIREFTTRHVEIQAALTLAGDPRSPFSQVRSLMAALDQCGLFRLCFELYRHTNPEPTTHRLEAVILMALQTHDNRPTVATTGDLRYAAEATNAPLTATQMDVARAIIAAESHALAASAPRRTAPAPPGRRARTETDHWCWSHGFLGHDSADCVNRRAGHNLNASAANRLGGSDHRRK
jgi:hypothetical protein